MKRSYGIIGLVLLTVLGSALYAAIFLLILWLYSKCFCLGFDLRYAGILTAMAAGACCWKLWRS